MNQNSRSNGHSRRRRQPSRGPDAAGLRELRQEVGELRRVNERGGGAQPRPAERQPRSAGAQPRSAGRGAAPRRHGRAPRGHVARRRRRLLLPGGVVVVALVLIVSGVFSSSPSFALPSRSTLAAMSLPQRIVAIAGSQVGYRTNPTGSYCNKFSAYWNAGASSCPSGEASEEWCADFAAWAWQKAGVDVTYGYAAGELNAGAISFYRWGVHHGTWHPAGDGYRARPGDVAVYGLNLVGYPTAAHVAIVTGDPPGRRGPDVINGDGDRTGFSVIEAGSDQLRADAGHHQHALLAGYVSP